VVLDGSGADELLGGYDDYRLLAAADAAAPRAAQGDGALARFLRGPDEAVAAWHYRCHGEQRRVPWITGAARAALGVAAGGIDRPLDPAYRGRWRGSFLKHALRRSVVASWMNKSLEWDLRYLDRSGMWLGVEGRSPFLDHRLVAFALALPPGALVRRGRTKLVLRRAMRGHLPEAVRRDPRKVGFAFPLHGLARRSRCLRELLRDEALRSDGLGLFDPRAVAGEIDRLAAGAGGDANVWRAVNLAMWSRRFLARSPAPPRPAPAPAVLAGSVAS
jgi:asparagine synthase (glutamine-hydrolysing)